MLSIVNGREGGGGSISEERVEKMFPERPGGEINISQIDEFRMLPRSFAINYQDES